MSILVVGIELLAFISLCACWGLAIYEKMSGLYTHAYWYAGLLVLSLALFIVTAFLLLKVIPKYIRTLMYFKTTNYKLSTISIYLFVFFSLGFCFIFTLLMSGRALYFFSAQCSGMIESYKQGQFEKVIELSNESPPLFYLPIFHVTKLYRAEALCQLGEPEKAREEYLNFLENDPMLFDDIAASSLDLLEEGMERELGLLIKFEVAKDVSAKYKATKRLAWLYRFELKNYTKAMEMFLLLREFAQTDYQKQYVQESILELEAQGIKQ